MKARFKQNGIKKYKFKGNFVEIPSDGFIPIYDLQLYLELTRFPTVFDTVCYFEWRKLLPFKKVIEIKDDKIFTNKRTAPRIQNLPFTKKQAERDDGTVIFRITNFNEQNLARYGKIQDINVLVFRKLGGMGDCIMALPIVEMIAKRNPQYKITLAFPEYFLPLGKNNPHIDNLVPYTDKLLKDDYDAIIDLSTKCIEYETKNMPDVNLNRPQIFAKSINYPCEVKDTPMPRLYLSNKEIERSRNEYCN